MKWGVGMADEVAIVTGSSGGLGRAMAIRLASEGFKVVVNGRDPVAGEQVVRQIRETGGIASFVQADMLDKQQAQGLVRSALDSYGRVDVMVASAGTSASAKDPHRRSYGLFAETDPDAVAETVAKATLIKLNPVRAVVEHMIARGSGSILFITSEGGRVATPGQTAVSLFSGGLIMMTKVVAKELARHGIRVNTLTVTLVKDTPAWERYTTGALGTLGTKVFEKISRIAPFGLAEPADIAEIAAFLASNRSRFITGATVSATGGLTYA